MLEFSCLQFVWCDLLSTLSTAIFFAALQMLHKQRFDHNHPPSPFPRNPSEDVTVKVIVFGDMTRVVR